MPHITLKSIANNSEIDVVWEEYQTRLEPLHQQVNDALGKKWEQWEVPRESEESWAAKAKDLHAKWWELRLARQKAIDASIAAKADLEFLYDKPYEDKKKIRVAGPFTVESLSPHRVLAVTEDEELIETSGQSDPDARDAKDFVQIILDNLKISGVQQAHKEDKIDFTSLAPWPGNYICAEGRYTEADGSEKRAGIFFGPEFGTVTREDLVAAAREAGDAAFDVLITCAFSYDAHSADSIGDEIDGVREWLTKLTSDGLKPHEIALFVRSAAQLDRPKAAVEKAGMKYKLLDERVEMTPGFLSISTMHLAKGLEFQAVGVVACDDEVIPLQERIETVADEADLEDIYNTERQLLYVACTRARDHLLVTSTAPASEFLEDLVH